MTWHHHARTITDQHPATGRVLFRVVCTCGRCFGPYSRPVLAEHAARWHTDVHAVLDPYWTDPEDPYDHAVN